MFTGEDAPPGVAAAEPAALVAVPGGIAVGAWPAAAVEPVALLAAGDGIAVGAWPAAAVEPVALLAAGDGIAVEDEAVVAGVLPVFAVSVEPLAVELAASVARDGIAAEDGSEVSVVRAEPVVLVALGGLAESGGLGLDAAAPGDESLELVDLSPAQADYLLADCWLAELRLAE